MKPAAEGMRVALQSVNLRDPVVPVVSCLDGSLVSAWQRKTGLRSQISAIPTHITSRDSLITCLVKQIQLPVRWSQCVSNLAANDVSRLIFLGPGKALANLARKDLSNGSSPPASAKNGNGDGNGAEVVSVATEDDMKSFRDTIRLEREKSISEQRKKHNSDN